MIVATSEARFSSQLLVGHRVLQKLSSALLPKYKSAPGWEEVGESRSAAGCSIAIAGNPTNTRDVVGSFSTEDVRSLDCP